MTTLPARFPRLFVWVMVPLAVFVLGQVAGCGKRTSIVAMASNAVSNSNVVIEDAILLVRDAQDLAEKAVAQLESERVHSGKLATQYAWFILQLMDRLGTNQVTLNGIVPTNGWSIHVRGDLWLESNGIVMLNVVTNAGFLRSPLTFTNQ